MIKSKKFMMQMVLKNEIKSTLFEKASKENVQNHGPYGLSGTVGRYGRLPVHARPVDPDLNNVKHIFIFYKIKVLKN